MKLRKVNIQDLETLKKIAKQTFIETYTSVNNEEDMSEYLDEKFLPRQLRLK